MKRLLAVLMLSIVLTNCGETAEERAALTRKYQPVADAMDEMDILGFDVVPGRDGVKEFKEIHEDHRYYNYPEDDNEINCYRHELDNDQVSYMMNSRAYSKGPLGDKFHRVSVDFNVKFKNPVDDIPGNVYFVAALFEKWKEVWGEPVDDVANERHYWIICEEPKTKLSMIARPEHDEIRIEVELLPTTLLRETYNGSGDKGELQPDIKDMGSQSDQRVLGGDTQVDLAYDAIVKMETNMGTILIDLYEDRAPKHSANFKKLANEGAFSDTYFHRVIPNFIVQGGDPLTRDNTNRQDDGTGGIGGNIPPEIGQPHLRGTLAAARDNNPEKKSNGSQFYFCLADLPNLDGEYTVFGKIVQGMDIVDEMGSVKTDRRDNPREAIIILNTEVIRK